MEQDVPNDNQQAGNRFPGKEEIMEYQALIIWVAAAAIAVLYFARRRRRKQNE